MTFRNEKKMDQRIELSNQFTIDTMNKFNIEEFKGFEKDTELFEFVKMYYDLFENTIRNFYEMTMDHPLFMLYNITLQGVSGDEYCESKEEFAERIETSLMRINNLI